ncbi:hypothetical protein ACN4EE_14645 [Geminocystis sp. CENA526]|uniref:hypothetical protein n=1 Tax=Geminocystis sp. CENA526 TaxID=1355871 RepID=UPI003D6F9D07
MINLQRVTLITGMSGILISFFGFSPNAFAGSGGMAGSAAFQVDSVVTGVGVSAAVGENGAGAWSFNDSSATGKNSAGSMGSGGAITIGGAGNEFDASKVGKVVDSAGSTTLDNSNTLTGNADLKLGTGSNNVIVDSTP